MPPFDNDVRINNQQSDTHMDKDHGLARLGYIALIPFGFGALCLWLSPWVLQISRALIIQQGTLFYGAIIATYMAGMGAGNALTKNKKSITAYLPSALITLIAWLAIVPQGYFFITLQPAWRVMILIFIFSWLAFRDITLSASGTWPKWYGALRFRLSAWVIIALMAIFARLILWHQY